MKIILRYYCTVRFCYRYIPPIYITFQPQKINMCRYTVSLLWFAMNRP